MTSFLTSSIQCTCTFTFSKRNYTYFTPNCKIIHSKKIDQLHGTCTTLVLLKNVSSTEIMNIKYSKIMHLFMNIKPSVETN